jgi:hypothetical protein
VGLRNATFAAVLLAAIVGGCGDEPRKAHAPSDAAVIRRWADTLRAGDITGAARLFGLPVTVANGAPPERLTEAAQVRAFNESLPCGARLVRTRRRGRYTIATFRLTERRGGDCGSGVGATARTAFRLRDGRIVEWLRVPSGRAPTGPAPGTSTS